MKKIEQTIFDGVKGNCFQACLASILELELEDVPFYMDEEGNWFDQYNKWLEGLNLYMISFDLREVEDPTEFMKTWLPSKAYALLAVESLRHPGKLHSVVLQNNEIVWDPNPQRDQGVGRWKDLTIFGKIDPSDNTQYVFLYTKGKHPYIFSNIIKEE